MNLETLTTAELAAKYNDAAATLGEAAVKRFSDKKSAVRRTTAIVARLPETTEAKRRPMRFVFRPEKVIRECKVTAKNMKSGSTKTLRQRALDKLLTKKGATFEEIKQVVLDFDKDRGVKPKNHERRAYELVRLIHYYLGYGLKEHGDHIIAYTDPEDYK